MATNPTVTGRRLRPLGGILTGKACVLAVRILRGLIFIYSSVDKVADPARFAVAVRGYDLLPLPLTNVFALVLAWAELIAGIMLVFGVYARQAAAAVLLLIIMFTGAIGMTMVRGMVIDCGCFSNEGGTQTGYWLVVRNVLLGAMALIIMRYDTGSAGLTRYLSKRQAAGRS